MNSGASLQVSLCQTPTNTGLHSCNPSGVIGQCSSTRRGKTMKAVVITNTAHRITDYSELQGTHNNLQVQL